MADVVKTPCEKQLGSEYFQELRSWIAGKEFKTVRNFKWLCSQAVKPAEHNSFSTVSCCPSPVKFVVAITIFDGLL